MVDLPDESSLPFAFWSNNILLIQGYIVEICLDFIDNNNTPPLYLVEASLVVSAQLVACFKALLSALLPPINEDN